MPLLRRGLLAGGGIAAMIAALALPEILTPDVVADDTLGVYGTDCVADTDLAKLNASLLGQLKKANIEIPETHLFPELDSYKDKFYRLLAKSSEGVNEGLGMSSLPDLEGVMKSPRWSWQKYQVLGIPDGSDGVEFSRKAVADYSKDKLLDKTCQCGQTHSRIEKDYPAFRVFAALHELVHYIDAKYGIYQKLSMQAVAREGGIDPSDAGFQSNIRERLADAGAAVYLLSNYGDSPKYLQDVMDYRNASSEPTHYTASTTAAAIKAFGEKPQKALSLIEATEFAAAVIGKYPGLVGEYKDAAETFSQLRNGTAKPADPRVAKAVRARRSLFTFNPVG